MSTFLRFRLIGTTMSVLLLLQMVSISTKSFAFAFTPSQNSRSATLIAIHAPAYPRLMSSKLQAVQVDPDHSSTTHNNMKTTINRKMALKQMALIPFLMTQSSNIAEAKISIKPEAAFAGLVKGREELDYAFANFLNKKDYDSMREYFADESLNMNKYEENASALLASKQLDSESKVAIGTIRRYGVGADVIIMYGGLKGEIDEENESPNFSTVSKMMKQTMDSLDEVIAICRSNGF